MDYERDGDWLAISGIILALIIIALGMTKVCLNILEYMEGTTNAFS